MTTMIQQLPLLIMTTTTTTMMMTIITLSGMVTFVILTDDIEIGLGHFVIASNALKPPLVLNGHPLDLQVVLAHRHLTHDGVPGVGPEFPIVVWAGKR